MAHIGRDEVVRRRLISGVSRKKSKEIIDEIVTRRSRWVYFCPGSTQEMAVQRSGRGIVDETTLAALAAPASATDTMPWGCSYVFVNSLGS